MSRGAEFDVLFDRLEAALVQSRSMDLSFLSYLLVLAIQEATGVLRSELFDPAQKRRKMHHDESDNGASRSILRRDAIRNRKRRMPRPRHSDIARVPGHAT